MHAAFELTVTAGPEHLDEQGHVNNVVYVQWVQDVAVAHWETAVPSEVRDAYTWMLTRHEIDYRRQTFEGDRLVLRTWVGTASRISCERFTEISRGGEVLASARSQWCLIDRRTGRPARIPGDMRSVFAMRDS